MKSKHVRHKRSFILFPVSRNLCDRHVGIDFIQRKYIYILFCVYDGDTLLSFEDSEKNNSNDKRHQKQLFHHAI